MDIESQLKAHVTWLEECANSLGSAGVRKTESRACGNTHYTADTLIQAWQLMQVLSSTESLERAVQHSIRLALPETLADVIINRREAVCCTKP
jgi:hypothetical protein